jgi:hypothetical protein
MSIREAFLQKFPNGDNLEPRCYNFFHAGYLAAEELQFQIRLGLEKQIQGHVLEVLKLREELAAMTLSNEMWMDEAKGWN